MTRRMLAALLLSIPLAACQTLQGGGTGGEDKFTAAYLQTHLKPGVTTSEQVRQLYGKPDTTQEGPNGPSMWTYRPRNTANADLLSSAMGAFGLGAASSLTGAAPADSYTLFIHFQNNKVSDYSLSQI